MTALCFELFSIFLVVLKVVLKHRRLKVPKVGGAQQCKYPEAGSGDMLPRNF